MKRILTNIVFIFFIPIVYAQTAQSFSMRVDVRNARCYNNALVALSLNDADGLPSDSLSPDISIMRYYYRNILEDTLSYTYNHEFLLDNGTYQVGISAIYHTHSGGAGEYILIDTSTVITIANEYVPPHLYTISHLATQNDEFGLRPALGCEATGRVQLNIDGGVFPYTVHVINTLTKDTIRTLTFSAPQYAGTDPLRYDYAGYYTIDSLPAGTYTFALVDSCGYESMTATQTVTSVNIATFGNAQWYGSSGNLYNHNVLKMQIVLTIPYQYYLPRLKDYIQYHSIFPNGDISQRKPLPAPSAVSGNDYTFIFYDTAYTANNYCDLWDTVTFVIENLSCMPSQKEYKSKLSPPDPTRFKTNTQSQNLGRRVIDEQNDFCSYTYPITIDSTYTLSQGWTYEQVGSFGTSLLLPFNSFRPDFMHFYTLPLTIIYKDELSNQIIKEETFNDIFRIPQLTRADIINFYHRDYDSIPIIAHIHSILRDARGCILLDRINDFPFHRNVQRSGGSTYSTTSGIGLRDPLSATCCANYLRGMDLIISHIPLYIMDSITIELYATPIQNLYNFTLTIFPNKDSSVLIKEHLDNLAQISYTSSNNSLLLTMQDYCFPSGTYEFRITTPCRTFKSIGRLGFKSYTHATLAEKPQFRMDYGCNELLITPIGGKFIRHQQASMHPLAQEGRISDTTTAYFQIIDGPAGGFSDAIVPINTPLHASIPGYYTVRMLYQGDSHTCPSDYYDSVIYYDGRQVEFEYATAYLCDSLSTEGTVCIQGKRGSLPYHYTLYSARDKGGTVLGENDTGIFDHVPLRSGQNISATVSDSCGNSFFINFNVVELTETQKAWFDDGTRNISSCEGGTVNIYTLRLSEHISYVWTGPDHFTATTYQPEISISKGTASGYYMVSLLNTGCSQPIEDSVWINVVEAPHVTTTMDTLICPGEEIRLDFFPHGTDTIRYTLTQEELGIYHIYEYEGMPNSHQTFDYTAYTEGKFWISHIEDARCRYDFISDTIHIHLKNNNQYACSLLTLNDTVCAGETAMLAVQSTQTPPYVLNWYDTNAYLLPLRTDTINDEEFSYFSIPNLQKEENLYVTISSLGECESKANTIQRWTLMQNQVVSMHCGENIRWYDSGGPYQPYSNNESIIHTFINEDGSPISLTFNTFQTMEEDILYVFNSRLPSPDSIIASLRGDMRNALPAPIQSDNGIICTQFVSNRVSNNLGWIGTISTMPPSEKVTAHLVEPLSVTLSCSSQGPYIVGDTITLQAHIPNELVGTYNYQWYTRPNWNAPWCADTFQTAGNDAVATFIVDTPTLSIRVVVQHESDFSCQHSAETEFHTFIPSPELSLKLSSSYYSCDSTITLNLSITNAMKGAANNLQVIIHIPEELQFINEEDSIQHIEHIAEISTYQRTIQLHYTENVSLARPTIIAAQIATCDESDQIEETIYGDWDWQRTPLQADEDTAHILLRPRLQKQDIVVATEEHPLLCYDSDFAVWCSTNIPHTQYVNWYQDAALNKFLFSDTLIYPELSSVSLHNIKKDTSFYITILSDSVCFDQEMLIPIQLSVLPHHHDTIYDTVCQNTTPYHLGGFTSIDISTAGTLVIDSIFQTENGCDSMVTLFLNIKEIPQPVDMQDTLYCSGSEYTLRPLQGNNTQHAYFQWDITNASTQLTGYNSSEIWQDDFRQTITNLSNDMGEIGYSVRALDDGCASEPFILRLTVLPQVDFTFNNNDTTIYLTYGQCDTLLTSSFLNDLFPVLSSNNPLQITRETDSIKAKSETTHTLIWNIKDSCGNVWEIPRHIHIAHAPCPEAIDYDGNHYTSVLIDCNCWTNRNLQSEHFSDGRAVEGYYTYDSVLQGNIIPYNSQFGYLYSWAAAVDSSGKNIATGFQGICPSGWRLPTQEEYQKLLLHGDDLRSPLYWIDGGGSNLSGFSSLPAGFYNGENRRYEGIGATAYYWTWSEEQAPFTPYVYNQQYYCDFHSIENLRGNMGYSVRCIKNNE